MSETGSGQSTSSDENQGGAGAPDPGSSGDGGAGGTPDVSALTAALEKEQARARDFQSQKDRTDAENARLKAELEAMRSGSGSGDGGSGQSTPPTVTPQDIQRMLDVRDARPALEQEFPHADPALFRRSDWDSVEAFRAAVEQSHKGIEARLTSALETREAELRQRYEEKYGPLGETPTGTGSSTPDGLPSAEQIAGMSWSEKDALIARIGQEAYNRIVYGA